MTESEMIKQVAKSKRANIIAFCILIALIIAGIIKYNLNCYKHTFTTTKWIDNPSQRVNIVDDMLSKNNLVGMNNEKIINLLGNDSGDNAYFQTKDNLVYYLGDTSDYIDSEWLVITFKNGIVSKTEIMED
jgi:hypothetical protein